MTTIGRTVLSRDRATARDSSGDGLPAPAFEPGADFKTGHCADFPGRV
jgi:hypothetical protein